MGQTQDRQTGSTERWRSKTRLIQLGTGNGEMVGWAQGKTLRGLRSRTPLNPFKVLGSSGSRSSAGISILACSFCYFHSLAFFFNIQCIHLCSDLVKPACQADLSTVLAALPCSRFWFIHFSVPSASKITGRTQVQDCQLCNTNTFSQA